MEYVTSILVLLIMLGALLGFAWLARRFQWVPGAISVSDSKEIEIKETRALDTKSRIFEISWRGQRLLIARAENGITLLGQDPIFPANTAASSRKEDPSP